MARSIALLVLLSLVALVASQQSLCDKYANITKFTDSQLVNAIVGAVVTSVFTNSITAPYFDGSLIAQWPQATNFSTPANPRTAPLVANLNTFFGAALGCTDGTIGNYTGRNMTAAHAAFPVGAVQFESFNRQVLAVAGANGVTAADQSALLGVLNSLKSQICNQASCLNTVPTSICDRYSAALNTTEYGLIDFVVKAVVTNVTSASSPLKIYFDGTVPGTRNFTGAANAGIAAILIQHLDQFFGLPTVLGCTYPAYPAYQGRSLLASHANLQIDAGAFNLFNTVLLNILTGAGVAQADVTAVAGVLESTRSVIVTRNTTLTTTTGFATGTTGATTGSTTGAAATTAAQTIGTSSTSAASTVFMSVFALFLVLAVYLF